MAASWRGRGEKSRARTSPKAIGSGRCRGSRIGSFETVSKLRRDELYESPIVRESLKKSGTRVTRPSEHKVFETVSFRRKPSCFPRFPCTKRLRRCYVLFCGDGILHYERPDHHCGAGGRGDAGTACLHSREQPAGTTRRTTCSGQCVARPERT